METGLLFMIKNLTNIACKSFKNTDLRKTQLSIQINLDGFSFCIYNLTSKQPIKFQRFEFNNRATTPEQLLNYIKTIYQNNDVLSMSYEKVNVIHQNELATLVPNAFFDQKNLKNYIKKSVKVLDIDFLSFDTLASVDATSVYIPFVNVNNFIFSIHGSFTYFHSFSILIEKLQKEDLKNDKDKIFIHVNNTSFEILVFKNNTLQAINSFEIETSEDFIYYILFTAEQFDLNTETLDLMLLGDINKESERYAILYRYIRNIHFYSNTQKRLPKEFQNLTSQSNFILFNEQ